MQQSLELTVFYRHRHHRPLTWLIDPRTVLAITLGLVVTDAATFDGWLDAIRFRSRSEERSPLPVEPPRASRHRRSLSMRRIGRGREIGDWQ